VKTSAKKGIYARLATSKRLKRRYPDGLKANAVDLAERDPERVKYE